MTSIATAEVSRSGRRPTVLYQFMLAPPPLPVNTGLEGMVFEDTMKYADLTSLAADWTVSQGDNVEITAGVNNELYGANSVQLEIQGSGGAPAEISQTISGLTPGASCWAAFQWWADGHWYEPMVVRLQSGATTKSKSVNPGRGAAAASGESVTPVLAVAGGGSVTITVYVNPGYPGIPHSDLMVIGRIRLFVDAAPVVAPVDIVDFFRTSFRKPVSYQSNIYTPCEIDHTEPSWGVEDSPGTIQITLPADDEIAEFFRLSLTPAIPMVAIYEFHRPPDTEPEIGNVRNALYEITSAEHTPHETVLTCTSILGQGDIIVPSGLAQRDFCTFATYDAATCGVDPAGYTYDGEVTDIDDLVVTVSGAAAFGGDDPEFFTLGDMSIGIYHTMIRQQSGDALTLEEMIPGLVVGDTVRLLAGDDRTKEACYVKFGNSARRLSFPRMPVVNPYYGQGLRT